MTMHDTPDSLGMQLPAGAAAAAVACPGCGGSNFEELVMLEDLPVHGTEVFETADAARRAPRGDQVLALCLSCGLVFNTRFNAALLDYSGSHEPSQHYSPHFVNYARQLASDWVRDHALAGTIGCEIGPGNGDFMCLLLETGVDRMIAVDPMLRASQVPPEFSGRTIVHTEGFRPEHVEPGTSFVCSRHTFEHIPDIGPFLESVAEGMRGAGTQLLLSEVPELARILASGAFWDLQYEHCSYFTETTLLGHLSRAGFGSGRSRLTYSDQYLVAEARLDENLQGSDGWRAIGPPAPAEIDALHRLSRTFAGRVENALQRWGEWFEDRARAGKEVAVWGGGAKGLTFLNCLRPRCVRRVVDVNRGLQGRFLGGLGLPICAPEDLQRDPPGSILLMNPVYLREVRGMLDDLGLDRTELLAVEV